MKKVLLSLAAVGTALSANAQALLDYDFDTNKILPGSVVTENWYSVDSETGEVKYADFENCQCIFPYEGAGIDGSNSLWVQTDRTANTWERVVAFTNTGVAENKSYRISLWVRGSGAFNLALLKGCFNHDQALQAGNGTTYVDQTKNFTAADETDFTRFSYVVWSPSREVMSAKKPDFENDEYWNQDFLRLAFTGQGNYSVDDIKIEESTVENITFNSNTIRVDFGYATNATELAKDAAFILDPSCVTVTVDGTPLDAEAIEAVEIKTSGVFYIFINEDVISLSSDAQVAVSFTNPGDLKYSSNVAPECFTNPNCAVYSFENEPAFYNEKLEVVFSSAWEEATLVSADPADDSFEWLGSIDTFSFTFDKEVSTNDEANGAPTAILNGPGLGDGEELAVVENSELSNTLTFKRTGTEALADGMYTITVENVANANHVATTTPFTITFEVGLVEVGTIEYTDVASYWIEGEFKAAQPTNGWIAYYDGAENTDGGQTRVANIVTEGQGVGYYFCQRGGSVASQLTYGEKEDAPLTLPAGNVQIKVYFTMWQNGASSISYKLVKKDNPDEIVSSGSLSTEANTADWATSVIVPGQAIMLPNTEAGDYIFTAEIAASWSGTIFYGIDVKTYEEQGPRVNPDVIINESFADVANGNVPAAGTGWAVYENNTLLSKGEGHSGHTRMMQPQTCSNLSIGFYNRCLGGGDPTAFYMTYGEPAPEGQEEAEPELILENAKYSFSWYAVNWKTDNGNTYYFALINAETGDVEYEMTPVVVKPNVNGGAQNADAVQIQFNYVPVGGKYIMKWWMTGESIIGKIRVEKMGSLAAYWKTKLINDGLTAAQDERAQADIDEYAGTTRNNLDAVIAQNTNPTTYHTPAEYQAGIDDCLAAAKAMSTRRAAIAAYKSDIVKLAEALETVDAKYEALEIIPELKALVAQYAEVDPSTLEDDELLPVQAKITAGVSAVSNVISAVDNLITKQIHNLLDAISLYGDKLSNEFTLGWVEKGEAAVTDNQVIAAELQKILTACIYDSIANGGYNFSTFDDETMDSYPDSLDITGYIANDMFYTVNAQKEYEASAANAAFPGWNITEGKVSNVWWWENTLSVSANNPAVNASLRNTGNNAFKVNQVLNNLPVGTYTMVMMTADCSNVADVSTSYTKKDESKPWSESVVYATVGETKVSTEANYGEGKTWRGASNTYLANIQGVAAAGENFVTMTIGADMNCTSDAAQVDDTKLYMTGKLEGFDYAAASAAILGSIPSELKAVERADAPVAVEYINLAGQKAVSEGAKIKIEHYSDGYVIVKKVVEK